jgi:peptidoglycan/LPS O-acetylase OafA/YrhL
VRYVAAQGDTAARGLSYDEYRLLTRFRGLDGLRALSILLVAYFHAAFIPKDERYVHWASGWSGVTIFFVISGFLITSLSLREESHDGAVSLRAFYTRRAFRILPAYYAVLALIVVCVAGFSVGGYPSELWHALPYYLTYRNEYAPPGPFLHSWSLAVEEKFYAAWPLLGFVLLRGRTGARAAGAAVLGCTFIVAGLVWPIGRWLQPYGAILVGCLLAVLLHDERTFRYLRALGRPAVATAAVVVWLGAHLLQAHFDNKTAYIFYPAAVAAMIGALQLVERGPVAQLRRLLHAPTVVRLGVLSYSFYLIHVLCGNIARKVFAEGTGPIGLMARYALMVALAWVAADILYRWLEQPLLRRGRSIAARYQ